MATLFNTLLLIPLWSMSVFESRAEIISPQEREEGHLYDYVDPTPSAVTLMQILDMMERLDASYNNSCTMDIMILMSALSSSDPPAWAIKMVDSFGKPGSGILLGGGQWPGSYSECQGVVQEDAVARRPFQGQFCWAYFAVKPAYVQVMIPGRKGGVSVKTGICVPNTCADAQLLEAAKLITGIYPIPWLNNYVNLTDIECLREHVIWENKADVAILILFCFILFCVLTGTTYDLWLRRRAPQNPEETPPTTTDTPKSCAGTFLLAMSVYSNGKKLLALDGGKQCLPAVNGIRVISMIWIIAGHCCLVSLISIDNVKSFLEQTRKMNLTTIFQAILAVDTFFFLSGFLVAYMYLNEHERRGGSVSWLKFYVHRYWRLTPTYLLIIWTIFGLGKYLGHGPFWIRPLQEDSICKKYWWANILYINNFLPDNTQCMSQSWYLANDMQFYIVSPLLLIPFTRSVRWSVFIAVLVLAVSSGLTAFIGVTHHFPIAVDFFNAPPGSAMYNESFHVLYSKPYFRIGPYIIGLLTGWFLQRSNKITIPKALVAAGWVTSITLMITIVYIVSDQEHYGVVFKGIYHACARTTWAAAVAWVLIACCSGNGGIVNSFLSCSIWNPLSRLTYCTFLWHPAAIFLTLGSTEATTHYAFMLLCVIILANVVYAFAGSVVLSLLFEAPFMGFENCLLRGKNNYKRLSKEVDRNA